MTSALIVAGIVALFATGIVGVVLSLFGRLNVDELFVGSSSKTSISVSLFGISILGFVLALLLTKLVPVAIALSVLIILVPNLYKAHQFQQLELKKMEATAAFAQSLADSVGGGQDLQGALQTASTNPPKAIGRELRQLRASLLTKSFDDSILRFVADVDNPAADLLGAHLLQSSNFAGGRLAAALRRVSEKLNEYILTQKKVTTSRRKQEFEIRGLTLLLVSFMILILLMAPEMLEIYRRDFVGQIKLSIVFGLALLGWVFASKFGEMLRQQQFQLKSGIK